MDTDEDTSALNVDEIYANGADDDNSTHRQIISADQLDIEAYINLYSGRTRISRLLFIASNCGDNLTMQLEALRMAFDEIKKGEDTILMREVVKKINGRLGSNYTLDEAWCDAIVKKADLKKEKLDAELTSYRTNLIKESIRMGYSDFGDFYYAHGQLGDAFKNYVRTRDYCTTSKHIVYMCMSAILVSIEMGQFPHISSYVSKAEQSVESLDTIATAKLRCAAGLSNLFAKKYKLAARKFIETSPELGSHYNEVISSQDVAMYGGLCALATFDRAELKSKVIDNTVFRNFLELVPEVRELINDFYSSRYALCLEYLGNLKSNLLLDIHLHSHVEALYDQIRQKALIQYTLPFVSVDLNMMANAFKTTVAGLQKELETLITDNQIQARIDSHSKVLYARHADLRNATFQRVLETGRAFDRDLQSMFLRSSIIKHESLHRSRSRKL
ncbi:COP9 signalosome complex subunit 1-like [Trifolium pratense]|uniref:COP9 signalosome complex subunit 1-like n=1 Tax=Trifolium pratense TaxID=57577 RepID=UPI001E696510|nr:COP9 signalosome complex subunit 1-like [Trifolium pratense]